MYPKLFPFKKLLPIGFVLVLLGYTGAYLSENISVSNNVNGRELPIYCVDTPDKKVALSFDAAWGNEDTPTILSILKKHNIHVTFFMTGGWVENYPEDVKAIYDAGHDLGNHSQNHKNMSQLGVEDCKDELLSVHDEVKKLTGYEMFLFRPPFGDYDDEVITTASALEEVITKLTDKGYQIVPVSELIYRDNYHMDVAGRQIADKN